MLLTWSEHDYSSHQEIGGKYGLVIIFIEQKKKKRKKNIYIYTHMYTHTHHITHLDHSYIVYSIIGTNTSK